MLQIPLGCLPVFPEELLKGPPKLLYALAAREETRLADDLGQSGVPEPYDPTLRQQRPPGHAGRLQGVADAKG